MPKKTEPSRLVAYITSRMSTLEITSAELAVRSGALSTTVIDLILNDKTRLPLDYVEPIARGLDCDPRMLFRLALMQFLGEDAVERLTFDPAQELATLTAARAVAVATIAQFQGIADALDPIDTAVGVVRSQLDELELRLQKFGDALNGDAAKIARPST